MNPKVRAAEIEAGAGRAGTELVADVRATAAAVEAAWSEGFVAGELPPALDNLPHRLGDLRARRQLCAWLLDRASEPGRLQLEPWE